MKNPLTRAEAATELRCSTAKIDRMVKANQLPAVRIGKAVLIDGEAIASMLKLT